MALNKDFKVKDTINVGVSGIFGSGIRIGQSLQYWNETEGDYYTNPAIDSWGPILSGGRDLADFLGDGVDAIREGTQYQGTIEYSIQTDSDSDSDFQSNTIEVLGLQVTDAPTFTDLNLTGALSNNVSRIEGAKTLILDPVSQSYSVGTITFTPNNGTKQITVTILAKEADASKDIIAGTFNGQVAGGDTIAEVLEKIAVGTSSDYHLSITAQDANPDADITASNAQLPGGSTLDGANGISGGVAPEADNAVGGTVVIKGDLQVDGSTTTVNSTELTVTDKTITIAKDATDETQWTTAAIVVGDPTDPAQAQKIELTDVAGGGAASYWTITDDIHFGDSAATARLKGRGDQDVSITTGNTNTGEIKIANGANADISLLPNGSGKVVIGGANVLKGFASTLTTNDVDSDLLLNTANGTSGGRIRIGSGSVNYRAAIAGDVDSEINANTGNTLTQVEFDTGTAQVIDTASGVGDGASNIEIAPNSTGDIVLGNGANGVDVVTSGSHNLTLKTGAASTGTISITQGANADITLTTDGTGSINLKTAGVVVGDTLSDGVIKSNGAHNLKLQTGAGTTGHIEIVDGADGDINLVTNGAGKVNFTATGATPSSHQITQTGGDASVTNGVFTAPVAMDGTVTLDTVASSNDAIEAEIVIRKENAVQMIKLLAVTGQVGVRDAVAGDVGVFDQPDGTELTNEEFTAGGAQVVDTTVVVDGTTFGEVTVGQITLGDFLDVEIANGKYRFTLGTGTGTSATGSSDDGTGTSLDDCDLTVTIRAITA